MRKANRTTGSRVPSTEISAFCVWFQAKEVKHAALVKNFKDYSKLEAAENKQVSALPPFMVPLPPFMVFTLPVMVVVLPLLGTALTCSEPVLTLVPSVVSSTVTTPPNLYVLPLIC